MPNLQTTIRTWLLPHVISWEVIKKGKPVIQYALRVNTSGLINKKTAPAPIGYYDIDCDLKNGLHLFVEVKEDRDKIRPSQISFAEAMSSRGVHNIEAHSLEDVKKYFRSWGWIEE